MKKPEQPRQRANTADIVGGIKAARPIPSRWKREYDTLLRLREDLQKRQGGLQEIAKQEQAVFSLHMADAGTDQYDSDFALSMMSTEQGALYEIEQALNRIRDGTYGVCEITGQPIEA